MVVWKRMIGYDQHYEVSDTGEVRNTNYRGTGKVRFLNKHRNSKGYYRVGLLVNGVQKHKVIHRLVAEYYIPNINEKPQVNHIDEDRNNNNFENLEWCTSKENNNHGTRSKRAGETNAKVGTYEKIKKIRSVPITRTSEDGLVKVYASIKSVSEDGFNVSRVKNTFRRSNKFYKGYRWDLANERIKEAFDDIHA